MLAYTDDDALLAPLQGQCRVLDLADCTCPISVKTQGGSPKGLLHNLLMQFFTPGSSKIEVSETDFFDFVIT